MLKISFFLSCVTAVATAINLDTSLSAYGALMAEADAESSNHSCKTNSERHSRSIIDY